MLYKNSEYLNKLYIEERKSAKTIAVLCNTSQPTILKYLRRFNIPVRPYTENKSWIPKGGKMPAYITAAVVKANTGRKMPENVRDSILKANIGNKYRLGVPHTEETKNKIRQSHKLSGKFVKEKNPNWKGGKTSQNRKEREIFSREFRLKIMSRDGFQCVTCNKKGYLQVHHIKSWSEYPEERFNENNCETLCKECHYMRTFDKTMINVNSPWGHNFSKKGRV